MPRKIVRSSTEVPGYNSLLVALVAELRANRESGQPIVLERRLEATGNIAIDVVWDEFYQLDDAQRYRLIMDAYGQVEGPEFCKQITLASGYTVPEAVDAGLLPYSVLPARRRDDELAEDAYLQAMRAEGASELDSPSRPQLRFPTEEDAAQAIQRLENRLPHSYWILARDVRPVEAWHYR